MGPHTCVPFANPRHRGVCVKCGRPIHTSTRTDHTFQMPHVTPLAPLVRDRQPPVEDSIVAEAGKLAGYAYVQDLNDYAHARAHPGGVRLTGRDLKRELREEIADGRNYVVWDIIEAQIDGDPDGRIPALSRALACLVAAWRALDDLA